MNLEEDPKLDIRSGVGPGRLSNAKFLTILNGIRQKDKDAREILALKNENEKLTLHLEKAYEQMKITSKELLKIKTEARWRRATTN